MNAKRRIVATAVASLLMATTGLHGEFVGRSPGGGSRPAQRPAPGGGMNQGQRPSLIGGLMPTQNPTARPVNQPASPTLSRPNSMNLGMARPATQPSSPQPSISRPAVSRPSTVPSVQPPTANRPSVNLPIANRPNVNLPNVNPPTGGLKPATRPATPLPGTPSQPSITRPITTLPSTRPTPLPDTRPTRPSLPDLGGGNSGIRPPAVTLPARPGSGRPSPGDVGDFLGWQRPVTLPAVIDKRPGGGNPPAVTLPARPGPDNRPNWPKPGDINIGNKVINNRPTWVNIDNSKVINIQKNWSGQINNLHNWPARSPALIANWRHWGDDVRNRWRYYGAQRSWFTPNWWYAHRFGFGGWSYFYRFNRFPWRYWWGVPTFPALVNWFIWTAPAVVWAQPVYYAYGPGGNVVYNNNVVYINGERVATADEFAQSAMALATVPPPASEENAEEALWMPLGTFAISSEQKDVEPNRVIQLAVDKEGVISGTLYNPETDKTQAVQGQVDKETQRVAFRIGDSDRIVVETGLYNLTQEEAPALVHFGTDKVEDWLLVRLEAPETEEDAKQE